MWPYIFIYTLSITMMWFSNNLKYGERKQNLLRKIIVIFNIVILSVFFCVSASSVGTDKGMYSQIFEGTLNNMSFFDFLRNNSQIEKGYLLINWIIGKSFGNIYVFYFIYMTFINTLFYIFFKAFKDKVNLTLCWFIFLSIFYPVSFCLFRQSIAIAIISICVMLYYRYDRLVSSLVLILIAISIHSSAVIGFVFVLIIYVIKNYSFSSKKVLLYSLIALVVSLNITNILPKLVDFGFLSSKYSNYSTGFLASKETIGMGISPIFIIFSVLFIKQLKKDEFLRFLLFFSFLNLLILPLANFSEVLGRLGFYFKTFLVLYYAYLSNKIISSNKLSIQRLIFGLTLMGYLLFSPNNFIFGIVHQSGAGTFGLYPYSLNPVIERLIGLK